MFYFAEMYIDRPYKLKHVMKNSEMKQKTVRRHPWTLQMLSKSKLKQKTVWRHPWALQIMSQPKMKQKTTEKPPEVLGKADIGIECIQEVNLNPNRSDILWRENTQAITWNSYS